MIGSDTVVALNGRILGKPVDYDDAYNTLNSLSGQTHNVYTGVSIMYYDGEKCRTKTFYENTEVTFYPMTHEGEAPDILRREIRLTKQEAMGTDTGWSVL